MLNRDYVNGLIHNDDAFIFLRCARFSSAFWERKKKEVMAMIRQLGCSTLFLTLSAAETQWSELIIILTQVLENKVITLEEAESMSYEKKCDLIRNDPVTCVRYFQHRLKCLWEILSAPCGPFQGYELVDKYVRTESQVRGSPHVHVLLWLKNGPKYGENNPESIERCIEFIDKLISREQLMLFLPWSNEEKDFIHINHEETFELNKDLIQQKRSEYVHREANEFEKAFEEQTERGNDDDIDDTNIEYGQDKNEFLIYETGNNEGDIFVEMGINTRTEKFEHFNVPKMIPDADYQRLMRSLNSNQRKYTLNVMNLIKDGDKQFFHFINGGAGVGKSTLVKAVYQSILRFYNSLPWSNPETIRVAICAPTGKAAALIDGMTLHSFLSLPVNQCKHKLVKLDSDVSNRIGVKLKDLQLLIIDEISMVGFTMFQQVDARLQQIMKSKAPFGGISVIVLGDFNQLRSVGDKYIFQFNNSYNALVDNPLWSLFELFELTEIMRQKDDKTFAIALSNLAKGMMTLEDINLFKSRIISAEKLNVVEDAIRVFRSNAEVDAYNAKVLSSLNTEGATANAYDFCVGDGLASVKEKVLTNVKNLKTTETYGLPLEINLKVDAKYIMTVNIDIEDGLVNGAFGKLIMIDHGKLQKTNETVPCRLWIKFNEEKIGRKTIANFQNVMRNRNIDLSLTPIEPVTRQINTKSTNFKVERKQFPVVPCEAMTIYKSQGGTYEKVVVNLKKGMTRSELYVASSRATKAGGLYLVGDFVPLKPPESNDAVAMMFKNMRSERMLKFSLEFPKESQERFYLMFYNV
ncbi:unnamed protein product [Rotaria sordida]|uniref:ATP-dependent DNA helicase n=1 Tax=Rotaria sordida TaxID=392033 RepID=A0A814TMD9_9BILA|nr:unnamed protein product [Rotaria sordida]CAF1414814.1 unnamed protein product [Rotaria sordida]